MTDFELFKRRFVGQVLNENIKRELEWEAPTDLKVFHYLPDGSIVTMDFRPDRLRIYTDPNNVIVALVVG